MNGDANDKQNTPIPAASGITPTPEQLRARRRRNIAIALAIGAFAILFYVITIAKLGTGVLNRPL